jgi:hypothetical protein
MRDPFHEVAVAADEVRVVVDDAVSVAIERSREVRLRHRESDGVPNTLSEWSRRRLDTRCMAVLGMPRCFAAPLTELLEVVERELVAAEIERAIDEHRCVASREHEAIAVGPMRISRVVSHVPREQHVRKRRECHRRPRVARVRFLDAVHGERADGIDAQLVERRGRCGGGVVRHWCAPDRIMLRGSLNLAARATDRQRHAIQ